MIRLHLDVATACQMPAEDLRRGYTRPTGSAGVVVALALPSSTYHDRRVTTAA